ncbi:MAG: TIGR00725 family protein [Deltaproteobacteria bacterium]|nr:TIGR00725 family protein [Deltaproteobacteria bacterium]MBW1992832.1 TIGR00725 family protein [Deltaproteobacteria bacterium]MBW2150912.1 TIGR00725 family protein [Deltaproteobacteria bacterium]
MKRVPIIGVMGGGSVCAEDADNAYRLGRLIAKEGWILLNGGRKAGIMDASAKGAKDHGGLTIGILPDDTCHGASDYIDIPIITGMGNARNCINTLTSDVVVACPGGAGTLSEIALALKNNKPVILLNFPLNTAFERYRQQGLLFFSPTPEDCIEKIKAILSQ